MIAWSFNGLVTFNDGTTKSIAIINELDQGRRSAGNASDEATLLNRLAQNQAVQNFVTKMGRTPLSLTPSTDVKEIVFRFMAVVTNADIHVVGSNTKLGAESIVESNNLTAALAILNTDSGFVQLVGTELGS